MDSGHQVPSLRKALGVTEAAMNEAYDMLREMDNDMLERMWRAADPYKPADALLRWQIGHVIMSRFEGKANWFPGGKGPV